MTLFNVGWGARINGFDWPNLPKVWHVKIGTHLTQEEVIALEDVWF